MLHPGDPVARRGACCRQGSGDRSVPLPGPDRWIGSAVRPCRCSGRQRHARPGRAPWSGSCCPSSLGRSAACCACPCGGSGSSAPYPSASPRSRRRATGAVGPDIRGGVVIIEDLIRHLTVVHRGIAHVMVTHQLVTAVDVDVVLVAVMALAVFPVQRASQSFRRSLAGFSFHASGVSPALIVAFSSRLLRCLGTGTIDASMICPPIAK